MRTSAPAMYSLLIGSLALVGCHQGTNYKPLHRRPRAAFETTQEKKSEVPRGESTPATATDAPVKAEPAATSSPAPRSAQKQDASPPVLTKPEPAEIPAPQPTAAAPTPATVVTNRYWCNLARGVGQNNFVVTRYYFTEDLARTAAADQLVLAKDRPPARGTVSFNDEWSLVSSERVGTPRTRITVEPLGPEVAIASPTFDEQNDVMDEFVTVNPNVATSRSEIGDHGAVRVTVRDPLAADRALTFFACEDYSPNFADVKAAPPEAAPSVPPRTTKAPEAPAAPRPPEDPMLKVDRARLEGPFTAVPLAKAGFENSRWCSWTKEGDDYRIGVLLVGANKKITVSQFMKSKLEADLYDSVPLTALLLKPVAPLSITGGTDSSIVTSDGRGFRLVEDKNQSRVLIADSASAAAPPTAASEVYFQCVSTMIPGSKPALKRNLTYYMNLRERWSRD